MTNKTETSVYTNKLTLPQFDIVKFEIGSYLSQYTVGEYNLSYSSIWFGNSEIQLSQLRELLSCAADVLVVINVSISALHD